MPFSRVLKMMVLRTLNLSEGICFFGDAVAGEDSSGFKNRLISFLTKGGTVASTGISFCKKNL